jgi:hypothetical protein
MCYSLNTSIASYSIGMISGILALCTRQYVLASLIFAFVQMQLAEILIWKSIDDKNDDLNRIGTSFGKYLLPIHNFAIGVGIILSIHFLSETEKTSEFSTWIPLIIGLIFYVVILVLRYFRETYSDITLPLDPTCKDNTNRCQNPNNRLLWPWPHEWYIYSFIISLIILFIYVKPLSSQILLGIAFSSTFIISSIFQPKVVGSIWCNAAAIMCPILVVANYAVIRNMDSSDILT